jgi:murein DD-endopeptidase MepM/ murein hydrolase activator NlpD
MGDWDIAYCLRIQLTGSQNQITVINMTRHVLLFAAASLLVCACAHTSTEANKEPPDRDNVILSPLDYAASKVVEAINKQDSKALYAIYAKAMRDAFTPEATADFCRRLHQAKGRIVEVSPPDENRSAVYKLKAERGEWQAKITLDDNGQIVGLAITGPPAAPPPVKKTSVSMRLPFNEEVFVAWGGDNPEDNQHVISPFQRRATDLLIQDEQEKTHAGTGKKNEDYYVFGKKVVAAAPGTVVQAVDGIHDNVPGVTNRFLAIGNLVIIKQAETEYAVYAHLKNGSVSVKVGDKVEAGQVIGICGNSGHSTEAHLHFHVQDGLVMEGSWGIEPILSGVSVVREGKDSNPNNYTFLKGDRVNPINK